MWSHYSILLYLLYRSLLFSGFIHVNTRRAGSLHFILGMGTCLYFIVGIHHDLSEIYNSRDSLFPISSPILNTCPVFFL